MTDDRSQTNNDNTNPARRDQRLPATQRLRETDFDGIEVSRQRDSRSRPLPQRPAAPAPTDVIAPRAAVGNQARPANPQREPGREPREAVRATRAANQTPERTTDRPAGATRANSASVNNRAAANTGARPSGSGRPQPPARQGPPPANRKRADRVAAYGPEFDDFDDRDDLDDDEPLPPPPKTKTALLLAQAEDYHYQQLAHSGSMSQRIGYWWHTRPLWLMFIISCLCLAIIVLLSDQGNPILSSLRLNSIAGIGNEAPAAPPVPDGEHSVLGSPTITAQQAEAVLVRYGSPAIGTGAIWIAKGEKYGIDPAYALAFFVHESTAGTHPNWAGLKPDGSTTHNIGNIICAGYPTCYGRFRDYPNWETGIEDWYRLISVEYVKGRNATTLEQIIPIYAPSFENDVPRYIRTVEDLVGSWRRGVIR